MINSYLKIALRILSRENSYAFINVFGFAIGFACCIILALYLQSELSYDQHFAQHENIYRLVGLCKTAADRFQQLLRRKGFGKDAVGAKGR